MIKKLNEFNKEATLDVYNSKRKSLTPFPDNPFLRAFTNKKLNRSLNSYKVYWENGPECQKLRFKHLLNIGVKNNDTILDFGCGLGDLYEYIKEIGLNVNYIGVDINKNFIKDAISQHGVILKHIFPFKVNPKFYSINTINDVKEKFDWFLASGTFTYSFEIDEIIETLIKAYSKCNKGLAFNILPTRKDIVMSKSRLGNDNIHSFNPNNLLKELKKHFQNVSYQEKWITPSDDVDGIFYILK